MLQPAEGTMSGLQPPGTDRGSPEHDDSDESDKESDGGADRVHKAKLLR